MEWLEQTKKLSKSTDYIVLNTVDSIFDVLWYIDHSVLNNHKELLDDICARYHKPNPLDFDHDREKSEQFFKKKNGYTIQSEISKRIKRQYKGKAPTACFGNADWRSCVLSRFGIEMLSGFVDSSLLRCEAIQKDSTWAWFEVIDFMFERPELINPDSIDEYVTERIYYVCDKYRKNNPLKNGLRAKFGKFWKDENGKWQTERRKRY